MVFDWRGTLDVTIMEIGEGVFEVRPHLAIPSLAAGYGRAAMEFVLEKFKQDSG